jgi:hypothetical protein
MGHCDGFDYALWANAWNEAISKICVDLCVMGHSAGFSYPLWAVAKDLVKAMGHVAVGSWQQLVLRYGHKAKPISIAQN